MQQDMGTLVETVKESLEYLHEGAEKLGNHDSRIVYIETRLRMFERLILEGNSKPALLVQLALIQQEVTTIRTSGKQDPETLREKIKANSAIIIAIISAIAGWGTLAITALLK